MIEFWRCWHMTLSRFLRDYVYFPLGGNRQGSVRRYVNLMLTMLIGGLWHGAGWNFVLWGGLHGVYLVTNHLWRTLRPTPTGTYKNPLTSFACWSLTLAAVAIAWVPFRAETAGGSVAILSALTGATGLSVGDPELFFGTREIVTLIGLAVGVRVLPNVYEFMGEHAPEIPVVGTTTRGWQLSWQARPGWAVTIGVMAALSLISLHRVSEFLYFQF
jgi:D-alanyl-lipoteichoic acid acyltransferase DltB (MBOAT superfamily)